MRKGFLASVAALAAGAGAALGQGAPGQPPAYPTWPGAGPGAPAYVPSGPPAPYAAAPAGYMDPSAGYPGAPGGYPVGPAPGAGSPVPPATDMPANGPVPGPGCDHPGCSEEPKHKWEFLHKTGPQIHKAAGGPDRWWIDIEELIWVPRREKVPFPLATVSPPAAAGILGADGTDVLFGDKSIDYKAMSVLRLTGGLWDADHVCGIELSGFIQEHKGEFFDYTVPITARNTLARPVVDALTGQPTALLIAFPGAFGGELHIANTLQMGGAEGNFLYSLINCDRVKFNLLGGIRYIDEVEDLTISSRSVFPTADPNDPSLTDVLDSFHARNQFLGGQIGFESEFRHKRLFVDVTGKVGLGDMNQKLDVNGFTNTQVTGVTTHTPGGLLALDSNIGHFTINKFAYAPELTIKLGYQITQRVSAFVGYNALYLSRVLRPTYQLDQVVNPVLLPTSAQFGGSFGPVRPANTFTETDFWTQGVTLGLSIRY
jgi:hypothetical protein